MEKTLKQRFEEKFYITPGCWIWTAAKHGEGYGQMLSNGRLETAHRISYALYVGPIPLGDGYHGTVVCHKCDNRLCVNPDHLFVGSQKTNVRDMHSKRRGNEGAVNGMAKLSAEQIIAIRSDSRMQKLIAKDYGISQQHVSAIKRNVWRKNS
jgi:hypothetical protein